MQRLGAACVAAIALLGAGRAEAICGSAPLVAVVPTLRHLAPTNAHVWITLPAPWRSTGLCDPEAGEPCPKDTFTLAVRRAPQLGRARPWLVVTETESPEPRYLLNGVVGSRTVELTPTSPLDAGTFYEVHLLGSGAKTDAIVGLFETSATADTTAPAWSGTPTGRYDHPAPKPGTIYLSECGDPIARFEKLQPTDDTLAPADLRFDVRVREMTEPADLLRVPDAVMTPFTDGRESVYLWLGSTDDFRDEGLLPRDGRRMSVSLVIVDWAGNRSDDRSFDL